MAEEYMYGECDNCRDKTWLKDRFCSKCQPDVIDRLKEMFGMGDK